jgi:hypothetical protein
MILVMGVMDSEESVTCVQNHSRAVLLLTADCVGNHRARGV